MGRRAATLRRGAAALDAEACPRALPSLTVYLLDTNALSAVIHDPAGRVAQRLGLVGAGEVCTSVIVAAELRYGAERRGAPRLTRRVHDLLDRIDVRAFEAPADQVYGRLRAGLERDGQVIGGHDLLIAAHALALGLCLVTDNVSEFARVPDLRVENWQRMA